MNELLEDFEKVIRFDEKLNIKTNYGSIEARHYKEAIEVIEPILEKYDLKKPEFVETGIEIESLNKYFSKCIIKFIFYVIDKFPE